MIVEGNKAEMKVWDLGLKEFKVEKLNLIFRSFLGFGKWVLFNNNNYYYHHHTEAFLGQLLV